MSAAPRLARRRVADVAAQPWRNGGGSTRELIALPDGGSWWLRVSVAEVAADGPFSVYAGVERWFAVVDGAGVVLGFADGERRIEAGGSVLRFDGADAPACRLIDGPTHDLNLMLRGGARGSLQRAAAGTAWREAWAWRAVFTAGPARLHLADEAGAACVELDAGTLAYPLPAGACRVEPLRARAAAFWIGAEPGPAACAQEGTR